MAVCVTAGTRFCGLPNGNSPISAEGCAPTGLKYLNKIESHSACFEKSFTICSPICFVAPYGDSAFFSGDCSVTGILSGLPYTVQEEEKTKYFILNSLIHLRILIKENKLFS